MALVRVAAQDVSGHTYILDHMYLDLDLKNSLSCQSILVKTKTGYESLNLKVLASQTTKKNAELSVVLFRAKEIDHLHFYSGQSPSQLFAILNRETEVFDAVQQLGQLSSKTLKSEYKVLRKGENHVFLLNLDESGIYCAMVAVSHQVPPNTLSFQLSTKSPHGSLNSQQVLGFDILMRLAIAGLVFLAIGAKKYSDLKSKNLAREPILLQSIVFKILVPLEAILTIWCLFLCLLRNAEPFTFASTVLTYCNGFLHYLFQVQRYFVQYGLLLFASGYGVLYDFGDKSTSYHKFPSGKLKWPRRFLIADIISKPTLLVVQFALAKIPEESSTLSMSVGAAIVFLLVIMAGFQSVATICQIWFPYRYHKQVLKTIATSKHTKDEQKIDDILKTEKAFKTGIAVGIFITVLRPVINVVLMVATAGTEFEKLESSYGSYLGVGDIAIDIAQVFLIVVPFVYIWSAERCRLVFVEKSKDE